MDFKQQLFKIISNHVSMYWTVGIWTTALLYAFPVVSEEMLQQEETDLIVPEFSETQQEEFVSLGQEEKRQGYQSSVEMTLGQTTPFQSYGLGYEHLISSCSSWVFYLGQGNHRAKDLNKSSVDLFAQATQIGVKFHQRPAFHLPVYLEAGLSLGSLTGEITGGPTGVADSMKAQFIAVFTGVGYQKTFESGWFIRNQIVGTGHASLSAFSTGSASADLENAIKKNLTGTRAWAFVNLSFGFLF